MQPKNAMHVLAEQKVNKGVNIAFSVTMEMQKNWAVVILDNVSFIIIWTHQLL